MKKSIHVNRGDTPSRWQTPRLEGAVKNRGIKKRLKLKKPRNVRQLHKPQGLTEMERKQYQLPSKRH